jgi:hypothetical protein
VRGRGEPTSSEEDAMSRNRQCSICPKVYGTTADVAQCERDHYRKVFFAARAIIRQAPRYGENIVVPPGLWNDLMLAYSEIDPA